MSFCTAARRSLTAAERVAAIKKDWSSNPRWANVVRPYKAEKVVRLQGSMEPMDTYSKFSSEKAFDLFSKLKQEKSCSVTFGALDPTQAVQMAKVATSIYVSGWQCSSTASTSNEPGPDLADYPMDTVPNKVDQLVRALQFHDRKQWEDNKSKAGAVDHLVPIIADADAGHGGLTAVMRLTRMFIDAGAAGVHIEDQRAGAKKCGHMGGKVLVSTQEHCDRLVAARLQSDIQGASLLLVARSDSEAATLIDSDADTRDHEFIKGKTDDGEEATLSHRVRALLDGSDEKLKVWNEKVAELGMDEALALAKDLVGAEKLGVFDVQGARNREGFYSFHGCTEAAIKRMQSFGPYADLLWMETAKPELAQAEQFANGVRHLNKFGAYNLSPSFNWDAAGMTDTEITEYCKALGRLGFQFQFITLAGFHGSGMIADQLTQSFIKDRDMLGYVSKIQRVERDQGIELLTHQTWSGAQYVDACLGTVRGEIDDLGILSEGNTEDQF
eukprot:TRINITY_DN223_c0_g1_i1.p1 TRINITY_DN223_c0_g1~~TRINITY_DN223_c0_g1_i1.p1  ORF type:complete len:499 (-),score=215.34 TRINITY_DN223_c0_g1_i1:378-1874(-)